MINRLAALFLGIAVGVSVFPNNYASTHPVACQVSVASGGVSDSPIIVANDSFEHFLDEVKTKFVKTGISVSSQTLSNGDIIVRYRQEHDSPRTYIDLDFSVSDIKGAMRVWRHQQYTDRSEYAGDPIKSFYKMEANTGTSVQTNEGPTLIEFGRDMPSVFVCRPGKFRPQPIGLIRHAKANQLTTVVFGKDVIKVRLYLEPNIEEFEDGFVIVSNSRLLDLENSRNHMFLVAHDFWRVKPLLSDGWWFSSQQGAYEGAVADCYYPNPGFYPSQSMLLWYCQLDNRLFYDVVLTTMKMAVDSVTPEGFRRMPVKPVHFSALYGDFTDYVDTRFSVDGVRFLIKCAKLLDCKRAYDFSAMLALYLNDSLPTSSVDIGGGKLVSDYIFDSPPLKPVHISLNHSLCIVNYLLELEDLQGETEVSKLADLIMKAITSTSKQWKRVNGDLWYAYYPSQNIFDNDDYDLLTYNDLQDTQRLLEAFKRAGKPFVGSGPP